MSKEANTKTNEVVEVQLSADQIAEIIAATTEKLEKEFQERLAALEKQKVTVPQSAVDEAVAKDLKQKARETIDAVAATTTVPAATQTLAAVEVEPAVAPTPKLEWDWKKFGKNALIGVGVAAGATAAGFGGAMLYDKYQEKHSPSTATTSPVVADDTDLDDDSI